MKHKTTAFIFILVVGFLFFGWLIASTLEMMEFDLNPLQETLMRQLRRLKIPMFPGWPSP